MPRIDAGFYDIGRLDTLASQDTFVHRLDPRAKVLEIDTTSASACPGVVTNIVPPADAVRDSRGSATTNSENDVVTPQIL